MEHNILYLYAEIESILRHCLKQFCISYLHWPYDTKRILFPPWEIWMLWQVNHCCSSGYFPEGLGRHCSLDWSWTLLNFNINQKMSRVGPHSKLSTASRQLHNYKFEFLVAWFVVVVQSLSRVQLFVTSWTVACQAPLSSTVSWSLLKFMSIELVVLSNHLISPSALNLSQHQGLFQALRIRWPKYWSFSFGIRPSNELGKEYIKVPNWERLYVVTLLT